MYTQYCSNQGRALTEIENLKKINAQFSAFLEVVIIPLANTTKETGL